MMGNFNKGGRSGGWGFGGGFGGRNDRGPTTMHRATCSDCGNGCEVPFKPMGNKPVYCRDCFRKEEGSGSGGFGRPQKSNFGDRKMYDTTCSDCGSRCEVPFRPTGEKPVYCKQCFGANKNDNFELKKPDPSKEQFERLNAKLDKILKTLEMIGLKKEPIVVKEVVREIKKEAVVEKMEKGEEAPKAKKPKKGKKAK